MLAPNILTLEEQRAAVADADLVRPSACPTCDEGRMHVHDYRTRKPRGDGDWPPVIATVRFRCAACRAIWLVLPSFLARHLWRVWTTEMCIRDRDWNDRKYEMYGKLMKVYERVYPKWEALFEKQLGLTLDWKTIKDETD